MVDRSDPALKQAELDLINAPFEAAGWSRAIASVAHACGSPAAHLLGIGGPLITPLNIVTGFDERIHEHLGDPHLHGAVNWRIGVATVPMAVQHDADYAAYRARTDTADYDDMASDLDMQFGCQTMVLSDQTAFLGLALMRGRRQGPCSDDTLARFRALLRPLQRAVRCQLALDGEAAELMLGDFGGMTSATILLDRQGALAALTPAAEAAFEDDGPLRLVGLAVRLKSAAADRVFQHLLGHLLGCDPRRSNPLGQMPAGGWSLTLQRLPEREHGLGFDPHIALTVRDHRQELAHDNCA